MNHKYELERAFKLGRINRREFLQRSAALGAVVVAPGTLLSGMAQAAEPKRGGTLRLGMGGGHTTDSLDPGLHEDSMAINLEYQLRSYLTEVAPDGQLVGELAESWEVAPGATDWTFELRKGVEFHNGKSLTAHDVIASIQHHIKEGSTSKVAGQMGQIAEMSADGDHVVKINLKAGNADFPWLLSDYHVPIFPEDTGWQPGIGSGPYSLVSYEPGVRAETTRNPNYFKEGRPYFDGVIITGISDDAARDNALKTGQVDATNRVSQRTASLLDKVAGVQVMKIVGTKHYTVPMLTNVPPFDNIKVRQALRLAIDREAMLKTVLGGHGDLGNDLPIGRNQEFYNTDLPQRQYDPDQAAFILKEAGMEGLSVELSAADAAFDGAVDAAVLMAEHAKAAGIAINVIRESNDGYWSNVWQQTPWCMCYWSGRPTQDWMWTIAYQLGGAWNDNHWNNARFQELLIAARAEVDQAKRKDMYWEMQRLHWEEGGTVVPLFAADLMGVSDKLAIPDVVGSGWELDGHRAGERWSFA